MCSPTAARSSRTCTWRCASAGSTASSGPIGRRCRPPTTPRTYAGCRRSRTSTRRSARPRSASPRSTRLGFDLAGDPNIRTDLEDRPQKTPRPCVIPADPPTVVHLITRAAGRASRLPGLPPRGGPRAPLRRLRPRPSVHLPCAVARPRADRDLLVPRRVDHARAGLARAALRPLARAGGGERGGDDLPPRVPLPTLRGEVPLRARLLVALPGGRRHVRGLRRAADRGDRLRLPRGRVRRGHGRRLLLGRLPSRVDPLRPGARRTCCRYRRRGLVAEPGDGRPPPRSCSGRARSRRARRLPSGSASTRSTSARSSWRSRATRRRSAQRCKKPVKAVAPVSRPG